MHDLETTFWNLHAVAIERLGDDFFVDVAVGEAREFPERRNMAYCMGGKRGDLCVVVAPKLVRCDDPDRIEGVLRHEFGHAALWYLGRDHSERDADMMGERLFGDPIYYDSEEVQSLAPGVRPRPAHLPN
jgi:hypothetical protein